MKVRYLAGISAIAFGVPAAHAQVSSAPPVVTPAPPANGEAPTDKSGIADIIITATKVETTVQKTPQAITTIGGDVLSRQGVSNAQELNKLVGGLQIEQNGAGASIFIRGVGSRVLSPTSDPAVAFSVDGVYYARSSGTSATLFDLSRIEVVKGPQGTLYGRNATGGAVNVITNRPKLGVRSLDGEFEVGNFQAIRAMAAINLPLGDKAALRIAGQSIYRNGYLSDGYNDDNTKAGRISLLFQPSSRFSLYLSGDYAHQGGQGPGVVPVGPGANNNALTTRFVVPSDPYVGPSDPRIVAFVNRASPPSALAVPFPGIYCVGIPFPPPPAPQPANPTGAPAILTCGNPTGLTPIKPDGFLDNEFFGGNVTANADLGVGELTAVGGYRGTRINTLFRVDSSFQTNVNRTDQWSGELRLASKPGDGRFKWLIGGFYLNEKQVNRSVIDRNNAAVTNPVALPGSPLPVTRCFSPLDPDGPGPLPPVAGVCLAQATIIQTSFSIYDPSLVNETYAGFGQATFSFTNWLRVTGGIRYTHERKTETAGVVTNNYSLPVGVSVSYPSAGEVKYSDVSYRAGIELDLAPRSLLYATYSTAFHAGGFNLGVRQGPTTYEYQPEHVKSYIVGTKNRFFDNRLQINIEGFWLDYDNYQQGQFGRVNDGSTSCSTLNILTACPLTLRTNNAAKARVRGIEGDIVFAPMRNMTLNVNILYNDAKFLTFNQADAFTGAITSYAGSRIPGSVPWTITGGLNQAFPLANGGRIVFDARTQYKSSAFLWFTNSAATYQKGYTRTDLGLTYEAPGGKFSLTGFVRNLEDKATLLQGGPVDTPTGATFTNLNPPRTYGVNVGFHF